LSQAFRVSGTASSMSRAPSRSSSCAWTTTCPPVPPPITYF
jgi:hypothetical protein